MQLHDRIPEQGTGFALSYIFLRAQTRPGYQGTLNDLCGTARQLHLLLHDLLDLTL
ncbi:4e177a59-2a2c-44cc-9f95-248cce5772fd [Thermothielavioides terrestris]|uniref:4e177a59-2a2c-44cc-9f95-248cce5772fd n=1 Tax=Thermothielavioides terrestris TaxID=2587410 RepID=A0A446BEY2_9PEZI|nr:4e177a59-2a2c-44cc-9f95-248cce5772fd [Thermothielavioides terrestris]